MVFVMVLLTKIREGDSIFWKIVEPILDAVIVFVVLYVGLGYALKLSLAGIILSTFILTLELLILFVLIPFFIIFWVSIKGMYYLFKESFYATPVVKSYRGLKQVEEIKKASAEAARGFEALRAAGRMTQGAASKKK
jgi:hypothetical protein